MTLVISRFSDSEIKKALKLNDVKEIRIKGEPFILRIGASRVKGSWYYVEHRDGRTVRHKIAAYPNISAAEIYRLAPEIIGKFITDQPVITDEFETAGELFAWYRQRMIKDITMSKSRRSSLKVIFDRHLAPKLGDVRITKITKSVIDEFILDLQASYAISYIKLIFNALRVCFKRAVKLEKINAHPLCAFQWNDFISIPIRPKGTKLEKRDFSRVQNQIKMSHPSKGTLAFLMLAYGLRIGEARQIEWRHIDFKNGELVIPAQNTKTKKRHVLPIGKKVRRVLENYRSHSGDGFLFKSPSKSGAITNVAAALWMQEVSGREWTAHDLRKLARTMWADIGIDYFIAELLLNHTPSKLDLTYIHTQAKGQKIEALNKWHELLEF